MTPSITPEPGIETQLPDIAVPPTDLHLRAVAAGGHIIAPAVAAVG